MAVGEFKPWQFMTRFDVRDEATGELNLRRWRRKLPDAGRPAARGTLTRPRRRTQRAERAARVAAESLGPTPTVYAVLAEVLDLLGQEQKAQLLREQTVAQLLVPGGN